MTDYLTHYYREGTEPFRNLSALSDQEALEIMRRVCDDTPFGSRFQDPAQYLRNRKQTEQWVRAEFVASRALASEY